MYNQTIYYLHTMNNDVKHQEMQKNTLLKIVQFMDLTKQSFLKAAQYAFIFLAWLQQRNDNKQLFNYYFSIYLKIFHSRRLFRILKSIVFIEPIAKLIIQLKQKIIPQKIFSLLGHISTSLFYLCDNITIILMTINIPHYRVLRRVSYSILLVGLIFQTVSICLKLRSSFHRQSDLKNQLESMSPTQLLQILSQIDEQRKKIALELTKIMCDVFPTLARTNLPQIIVKTRINKGTVGFFGVIGAFLTIMLKVKKIPHLD